MAMIAISLNGLQLDRNSGKKKIGRNQEKDREVRQQLSDSKWRILTIWECAIKGKTRLDFNELICRTEKWVVSNYGDIEIGGTQL